MLERNTNNIKHFRVFGNKCYNKRNGENLEKNDSITNEGVFLKYSSIRKAYRCYNLKLKKMMESTDVRLDEAIDHRKPVDMDEDDEQTNN